MAADQLLISFVFASVIGFILLYAFFVTKTTRKVVPDGTKTISINEECTSPDDADVIIVGAGVAGAALAHTLGKVYSFFFLNFLLLIVLSVVVYLLV